jgi:pilus assembly protein CpaE
MLASQGYVVGVLAAKGGLGVSTVALNLAITYHQNHHAKVIAAEMKPGQGTWAQELNFANPVGLTNLLRMNPAEITPSTVEEQLVSTIYGVHLLLASNISKDVECISALAQYEAIVDRMAVLVPLVILDIGTYFHPAYDVLVGLCNEVILVTEPQPVALKQTRLLVDELRRSLAAVRLTVVTVNRTRQDHRASQPDRTSAQDPLRWVSTAAELLMAAARRPMGAAARGIIAQQFNTWLKPFPTPASQG